MGSNCSVPVLNCSRTQSFLAMPVYIFNFISSPQVQEAGCWTQDVQSAWRCNGGLLQVPRGLGVCESCKQASYSSHSLINSKLQEKGGTGAVFFAVCRGKVAEVWLYETVMRHGSKEASKCEIIGNWFCWRKWASSDRHRPSLSLSNGPKVWPFLLFIASCEIWSWPLLQGQAQETISAAAGRVWEGEIGWIRMVLSGRLNLGSQAITITR